MQVFILVGLSIIPFLSLAQSDSLVIAQKDKDLSPPEIFHCTPEPQYQGGEKALLKYLSEVNYPLEARNAGIEGTIYVRMKINENGEVYEVVLLKGPPELFDDSVKHHIMQMQFESMRKPLKTQYVIPIKFSLKD